MEGLAQSTGSVPTKPVRGTVAGGVMRVKRKEAGQRVEQAVAHAAAAVAEDQAGRYDAAVEGYLAAVELLLQAAHEDNLPEHILRVVRAKEAEYLGRAQLLSEGLQRAKAATKARSNTNVSDPSHLGKALKMSKDGIFSMLRSSTEEQAMSEVSRFAVLFGLPESSVARSQLFQCVLSITNKEGKALVNEQKAQVLLIGRHMCIATEADPVEAEGYAEKLFIPEITSMEKKRHGLMSARIQLLTLQDRTYVLGSVKAELHDSLSAMLTALCEQTKVFGVPLDALLVREGRLNLGIPKIVEETVNHISQHGLTQEGIFRISCDHMQLMKLVEMVDREVAIDWQNEEIHACTALLKKYLRDLPQPLFSPDLYSCFMAIHTLLEGDTEEAAMAKIESLIAVLPGPSLRLIKYVFDFLALAASQSAHNKMHLNNLALIFGPIMIGSEEGLNSAAYLRETDACNKLVLLMITHKERFFPSDLLTSSQLRASEPAVPKYSSATINTKTPSARGS